MGALIQRLEEAHHWAQVVPLIEHKIELDSTMFFDLARKMNAVALGRALFFSGRVPEAKAALALGPDDTYGRNLLQAIDLLGDTVSGQPHPDSLEQLQLRAAKPNAELVVQMATVAMRDRAKRQFKSKPDSNDWKFSCSAYAILMTVASRSAPSDQDAMRKVSKENCTEFVKAPPAAPH